MARTAVSGGQTPDQLAASAALVLTRLPLEGLFDHGGIEDGTTGWNWPVRTRCAWRHIPTLVATLNWVSANPVVNQKLSEKSSLAEQRVLELCGHLGWELVSVLVDVGTSTGSWHRRDTHTALLQAAHQLGGLGGRPRFRSEGHPHDPIGVTTEPSSKGDYSSVLRWLGTEDGFSAPALPKAPPRGSQPHPSSPAFGATNQNLRSACTSRPRSFNANRARYSP